MGVNTAYINEQDNKTAILYIKYITKKQKNQ